LSDRSLELVQQKDEVTAAMEQALFITVVGSALAVPWLGFAPLAVTFGGIIATALMVRSLVSQ